MTKTTGGPSYPVTTMHQVRISVGLRESHGTLPDGPIDVYGWEEDVYAYGEESRRKIGTRQLFQWYARGEFPPEGARFVERARV